MLGVRAARYSSQEWRRCIPSLLERYRSDTTHQKTIDFGYEQVPEQQKQSLVEQVFTNVAPKYDVMNDLMSAGLHRLWKDRLVDQLQPFGGMHHLDVAGGTGDVAFRIHRAIKRAELDSQAHDKPGSVCVCDINAAMLEVGRQRAQQQGLDLQWVEGNAEELPFATATFDSYTIAFGIRNVTHRDRALAEAYRVLKPGGLFMCLEFSHVQTAGLREFYDFYSFNVIPQIGRLVANDEGSYRYLVESIRTFPDQQAFAELIRTAGFKRVSYQNLMAGVVAIHSGFKL